MGGFSNDEGWVYQDEQNHMDFGSIVPRNVMIDTREKLVTVEWQAKTYTYTVKEQ